MPDKKDKTIIENLNENKKSKGKKTKASKRKKIKTMIKKTKNNSKINKETANNSKTKNIELLPTQGAQDKINEKNSKKNLDKFTLMNIDLNVYLQPNYIPPDSHIILNNYTFKEAVKYDKRETCVIFYIIALSKQIFFHTFLYRSPIELFPLRLCLFIFIISSDLALNALFYFNDNISKKYRSTKNLFLFTFSDNITVVFLSTFVGFILLTLLTKLSNLTNAIREVFMKEEEKIKTDKKYKVTEHRKNKILEEIDKILRNYKLKVIILIIIELILVIFSCISLRLFAMYIKKLKKAGCLIVSYLC